MKTLTIGQLARASGVGLETLRFYEREGLIEEPPRRPSGYRDYPAAAVDRVRFIRVAKTLGFSLKEIAELLSLRVHPVESCADARMLAVTHTDAIAARIHTLQRMQHTLKKLIASCDARKPTDACPILNSLEKDVTS